MNNLPPGWEVCHIDEAANAFVSATGKVYEFEFGENIIVLENGHRIGVTSFEFLGIHPVKHTIPIKFRVGETEQGNILIIYNGKEYLDIPLSWSGKHFVEVFK